jgi:hypothetical protein
MWDFNGGILPCVTRGCNDDMAIERKVPAEGRIISPWTRRMEGDIEE